MSTVVWFENKKTLLIKFSTVLPEKGHNLKTVLDQDKGRPESNFEISALRNLLEGNDQTKSICFQCQRQIFEDAEEKRSVQIISEERY